MELRRASMDVKLRQLSALLAAHPEADIAEVRQRVGEVACALCSSGMRDDFDQLVARSKSKP